MNMEQYDQYQENTFETLSVNYNIPELLSLPEYILRYGDELDQLYRALDSNYCDDFSEFVRSQYKKYCGRDGMVPRLPALS